MTTLRRRGWCDLDEIWYTNAGSRFFQNKKYFRVPGTDRKTANINRKILRVYNTFKVDAGKLAILKQKISTLMILLRSTVTDIFREVSYK